MADDKPIIYSFKAKARKYKQDACKHTNIIVSEAEWNVECAECGKLIDPIWWMLQMAYNEGHAELQVNKLKEFLKDRSFFTCKHCGKRSRI